MRFLDDGVIRRLLPVETASFPSPVPTQIVLSDEYLPVPQTAQQKPVEARLIEMSDRLAKRQGLSQRRFFQTPVGMAASFVAMNEVLGHYFGASEAEAATPGRQRTGRSSISPSTTQATWVDANPVDAMAEFDQTGRSSWTSDLAEIPEKYGVTNVYGDLGQISRGLLSPSRAPEDSRRSTASNHWARPTARSRPRFWAAIRPLDRQHAEQVNHDRFATMKTDYRANGGGRSNLRYGYVARPA